MEKNFLRSSPISRVFSPVAPVTPLVINPDDYWLINGVWGGPGAVCGGKWIQYTEKYSQKMKSEGRFSRKICQKCYDRAVAGKSKTFTALPGLLNMDTAISNPQYRIRVGDRKHISGGEYGEKRN